MVQMPRPIMLFISSSGHYRYSALARFVTHFAVDLVNAIDRNRYHSVLSTGPSLKNRSEDVDAVELSLVRRGVALASMTGVRTGAGVAFVVTGDVGGDD